MPITVNYDPAAGAVAPSAFQAGAGLYTQRQQEIARDQGNRDRALQFQAQQAYLDRAFAERQANRQQQQLAQQNAYRQQAQQQELLGNAMQQQMSLAAQAQQMQMRNAAYQQQSALQQQELTQKGLKDGSLRYSTAQKNQMSQLYSDWDKVNQAKNLSARDRQLAQQDLQRQFQQIQPRPVLEDERPIPIGERFQAETFEDPRFPGTRIGVDKNGKYYPISMIPRGTGAGGAKQEPPRNEAVQAPGSGFSITDPSSWVGALTGQGQNTVGFYDQAGKFHKNDAPKATTKSGAGDPTKDSAAYYKELMNQANKIYTANKESGMSMQEAKKEAEAVMQDHPMNPANKPSWLMGLLDPSGRLRAENQQAPEMTPWEQKQAARQDMIKQAKQRFEEEKAALLSSLSPGHRAEMIQKLSMIGFDPENMTEEQLQQYLGTGQPQQPQAAPQQQPVPMPTYQGEGNAVQMPTYQGEGNAVPMPTVPSMSSGPVLPENAILGQQLGVSDAVPYSPQWQQLPEEDRGLRSYAANQTMIQRLTDDYRTKMSGEPTTKKVLEHYQKGHSIVPIAVVQMGANYIEDKYGQAFDERYIEPEDKQLVRILMKANEQAANEAKKNPDRKVTKLK